MTSDYSPSVLEIVMVHQLLPCHSKVSGLQNTGAQFGFSYLRWKSTPSKNFQEEGGVETTHQWIVVGHCYPKFKFSYRLYPTIVRSHPPFSHFLWGKMQANFPIFLVMCPWLLVAARLKPLMTPWDPHRPFRRPFGQLPCRVRCSGWGLGGLWIAGYRGEIRRVGWKDWATWPVETTPTGTV